MAASGRFNDGRSAQPHDVEIAIESETLVICDLDGQKLARWRLDEIANVDEAPLRRALRLRNRQAGRARLTITNRPLINELSAAVPGLNEQRAGWRGATGIGVLLGLSIPVIALLFFVVLPRAPAALTRAIPVAWDEALGRQLSEQMIALFASLEESSQPTCTSSAGVLALERATARLNEAAVSPHQFTIAVLDVGMVNAFALPGGYIFLFRGLIESADSPNEVVGVLAHEMAHVIHRHGVEALIREAGLSLAFNAMFGGTGQQISQTLLGLSYSRDAEVEADRTAVTLLQTAGIDVTGLASFFRQIESDGGDLPDTLAFLSTHPPSAARAAMIEQAAADGGDSGMSDDDWNALRAICDA